MHPWGGGEWTFMGESGVFIPLLTNATCFLWRYWRAAWAGHLAPSIIMCRSSTIFHRCH